MILPSKYLSFIIMMLTLANLEVARSHLVQKIRYVLSSFKHLQFNALGVAAFEALHGLKIFLYKT